MPSDNRLGILLMVLTSLVLALQDGVSRHLADQYNVMMVVMVRYWFFAGFVTILASRQSGGVRAVAATGQPFLQVARGLLLAAEVCVAVFAFTKLGLVESHAIFTCYPLLVAALSVPLLGEKVGQDRWVPILFGFLGVLVILQPGFGVFSPYALIPLLSALMFALYSVLTRLAARRDTAATSYFWTAIAGAVGTSALGLWSWEPLARADWGWMVLLCLLAAGAHWLLIKCYEVAEASAVQPFAYFQLVFATFIGITAFGEALRWNVAVGAAMVCLAGVVTILRAR